jgi:adhesin/invasin
MQRRLSRFRSSVPRAAATALTGLFLVACNGDNGPRPPSSLAAVSSTSVTGTVGELIGDPLVVKVTDDRGAALGGIVVTFTVAEGGGSTTPAVDTTDNTGAASTRWRLGGTTGQQRVSAAIAGVTSQVNFTAAASAGAPASVAIQAGDNQSAVAGAAVTTAPAVLVRDRFNNPVNGTSVFFSVSAGGGAVTGSGATTNASGVATVGSWTLGATAGANRLTALVVANGVTANPVTFNATATAGAAAALQPQGATTLTATVGALVSPIPAVRVVDAAGNAVGNVTVTFAASTGSTVVGASKVTNSNGIAAPDGWQLGASLGTYTLTASVGAVTTVFTATARAGTATSLSIVAGNNQTATVGRTLPIDPAVRITDLLGNPIVGQEVVFEVTSGGGAALVRRPLTDANGVATVGAWTLGETPGTNSLRATATGLTLAGNPATFTATATAGAPTAMSVSAGANQSATAGSVVAVSPSVILRDNRGNPVAGVTVTFTPGPNSGSVTGGSALTNALGVATVGSWRLGATAGAQTLTASLAGLPDVVFSATAGAGAASAVQVVGSLILNDVQVNSFVTALPTLRVVDSNGNPVSGTSVTFEVVDGTGVTLTGATTTTGTDGLAQLTSWRIGTVAGAYSVRALVGELTPPEGVIWQVTGTPSVAAQVAVGVGSLVTQAAVASAAVASTPIVRVTDIYGNGVPAAVVTFTVGAGTSTVTGGGSSIGTVTDALGFASVGTWTMGTGSGARTLIATVNGVSISGNPVTFTATVPVPAP